MLVVPHLLHQDQMSTLFKHTRLTLAHCTHSSNNKLTFVCCCKRSSLPKRGLWYPKGHIHTSMIRNTLCSGFVFWLMWLALARGVVHAWSWTIANESSNLTLSPCCGVLLLVTGYRWLELWASVNYFVYQTIFCNSQTCNDHIWDGHKTISRIGHDLTLSLITLRLSRSYL